MSQGNEAGVIDDVIARATRELDLEDKVKLLTGAAAFSLHGNEAIGLRSMIFSDGPTGVRGSEFVGGEKVALFPNATLLAQAWDETAAARVGEMLAASPHPRVAYIWEPFSPLARPGICPAPFDRWFQYVVEENEGDFRQPVRDMLDYRYHPGAELLAVRSLAYDLVLNGWELGSGSVRIHRPDLQQDIFSMLGISEEQAQSRFGFLLDAFRYGAPPHAGFAFGIDRLTAILAGEDNIREVIAFPKTQSGSDPMLEAPSPPEAVQFEELGLRFVGLPPKPSAD